MNSEIGVLIGIIIAIVLLTASYFVISESVDIGDEGVDIINQTVQDGPEETSTNEVYPDSGGVQVSREKEVFL